MRLFLAVGCAALVAGSAHAQTQERSLIDRLLRPDTSLKNAAQNKKFATRSLSAGKNETLGTFYVPARRADKKLTLSQSFSTGKVRPGSFYDGTRTATLPQNKVEKSSNASAPSPTVQLRNVVDNAKEVEVHPIADQPTFIAHGKNQKSLDRKNAPLTVEQVRELLNKNK